MSDEQSVDLTPGVVWTDAQLAVVRDLTARAFRAEDTLRRAHDLAVEMINHPDDSAADWGYDLADLIDPLDGD